MLRDWNKCFCVGSYKTGTTSLESVFSSLGFSTVSNSVDTFSATRDALKGDYQLLRSVVEKFDYMGDSPFGLGSIFIVLDVLFPSSKFILTIRDEDSWFRSFRSFHKCRLASQDLLPSRDDISRWDFGYPGFGVDLLEYQFLNKPVDDHYPPFSKPFWDDFACANTFVERYRHRNASVLNYFMHRPNDLLVLDLSKELTTRRILHFLDLPLLFESDMPHLNRGRYSIPPLTPV